LKTSSFFLFAVLGFVTGAIATYLLVVAGTLVVWEILGVHDQDGGGSMALGLVIAPAIALIGGIAGAVLVLAWAARRARNAPPATADEAARDRQRLIMLGGAIVGGIVGSYAMNFCFWLVGAISFDSYWKVWAVSWLPTIAVLLGAVAGGLLTRNMLRK